jgi:hypothetical protein
MNEIKERNDFPDRLKLPIGNLEDGISNGKDWVLQGFIEDAAGILRPQTFEESSSCIGCHGGIGATIDSSFSYARKLDVSAFQRGWFHWSQKDLKGINEPKKEGSDKRQVTQGPAIHGWPMWHPDSTRLVYWGYNRLNGKSSIISCRLDGGGKMKLIESEEALDRPMWRPDGMIIAYNVAASKAYNLTIENFISVKNGFDAITYRPWDGIKSIQMNDWSPDGKKNRVHR